MPRKKKTDKPKTKGKWTEEKLLEAIFAIANGESIHQASKKYGVPYSTIRDRMRAGLITAPRIGRSAIFTEEQELQMAEAMKALASLFYGLTPIQIKKSAFEFATKHNIAHSFKAEKRAAGRAWFDGFITRHPSISIRKSEIAGVNRSFTSEEVSQFFNTWEKTIEKYGFPPSRIFNVDETCFLATSTAFGLQDMTIICSCSASGEFIPPMFIFPESQSDFSRIIPQDSGAIYRSLANGTSNTALFLVWLEHFKQHKCPTPDDPVAIILDNHESHVSIEAYEFCRDNGIVLISLPPHSSYCMQPIQISFFGPLKMEFNKQKDILLKQSREKKLTLDQSASVFFKVYVSLVSVNTAISGFEASGIWPVNRDKIGGEELSTTAPSNTLPNCAPELWEAVSNNSSAMLNVQVSQNDAKPTGLKGYCWQSADGFHGEDTSMDWFEELNSDADAQDLLHDDIEIETGLNPMKQQQQNHACSSAVLISSLKTGSKARQHRSKSLPRDFKLSLRSPVISSSDQKLSRRHLGRLTAAQDSRRSNFRRQNDSSLALQWKSSRRQSVISKNAALLILQSMSNPARETREKEELQEENFPDTAKKRGCSNSFGNSRVFGRKMTGKKEDDIYNDDASLCTVCEEDDKEMTLFNCPKCTTWSHIECMRKSR